MKLGEQIQMARKENNLTQEQLGQKLNVTRQAIYKWESGKGYPDIQNIIRLSELFEISIDELIKGDRSFQSKIKVKGGTGLFSNRHFLSSLTYFSFFFAPFLFPLLALLFSEAEIKKHGIRALVSHLIPIATFVFMVLIYGFIYFLSTKLEGITVPNASVQGISMLLLALITIAVAVWNINEGAKQLKQIDGGGKSHES